MSIITPYPTIVLIAGESIARRDYVFMAHETAPYTFIDGIVPGRAYKTDKSIRHKSINAMLVGFALNAASIGEPVQIQTIAGLWGFSGLVAGASYQPSGTAGQIERLENNRAALPSPVARAISTTNLEILPQQWEVRGKGFFEVSAFSNLIKYSDESIAASATLTASRTNPGASGGPTKAYYSGGSGPSNVSDALTFSVETFAAIGNITVARSAGACASSTAKHYLSGGTTGSVSNVIDSTTFALEAAFADVGDLTVARSGVGSRMSALRNFVCGGTTGSPTNTIDALTFSDESVADVTDMSSARNGVSASSSKDKIFIVGGDAPSNTIDALVFATNVCSALAATLSTARGFSGTVSSAVGMVTAGGSTGSASSVIGKLLFATETQATMAALISAQTNLGGAAS